ncbi:hypothetical protein ACLI1A_07255 [Flavobacterium sp. RHBU_3]|uniref:hypothetical protein n=1 Tax=Flavobacterium sp. RHBU_3 TaxID=3391184 RepID=UPI003984F40F
MIVFKGIFGTINESGNPESQSYKNDGAATDTSQQFFDPPTDDALLHHQHMIHNHDSHSSSHHDNHHSSHHDSSHSSHHDSHHSGSDFSDTGHSHSHSDF